MKKLKVGLVGLPNVGKSSFFQVVSKRQVLIANYPFSTINPNITPVNFHDERVVQLGNFFKSEKITFDTFELVDIAGIVKGASQKVGLGGEFLSNIRSVDLICHIVRCFKNDDIVHTEESIDPVRDIETINLELVNADFQQVERRIEKIKRSLKKENEKQLLEEKELLEKISSKMKNGTLVSKMELSKEEKLMIKPYCLLTDKPFIIVANYSFDDQGELRKIKEHYGKEKIIPIDICLEFECRDFFSHKNEEFDYSLFKVQDFSEMIISKLQLKSFFTAGKSESRNWITYLEANAAECAGLIHSDMKSKFVRVETYHINQMNSEKPPRREPASYIIRDGEVCKFLFSR